jgi:phosphoglycerate dehydrogenase-like enzyme
VRIVVLAPQFLPPEAAERLMSAAPDVEALVVPYEQWLGDADWDRLSGADAVVALDLPEGLLSRCPSLRWVQAIGAGTDHLPAQEMGSRGIALTNASGVAASSIAEFIIGRLLQEYKSFRALDSLQQEKRWEALHGARLAGRTLGIVGLGAIGRATAGLARAFGMHVVATRRQARRGDVDPDVDQLFPADDLSLMLPDCDVVVVSAPATSETDRLIGRDELAALKHGAILCNVARGSLLDEDAVVSALHSGKLAAAILDVVQTEPLPPTSPLWSAPNCYLSAHTATSHDGYAEALLELLIRNLRRFVAGDELENVVRLRSHTAPKGGA